MIEKHLSINNEEYVKDVRDALKNIAEVKKYQSFEELEDLSEMDQAVVNVSVVSVYIEAQDLQSDAARGYLRKAIFEAFCEHTKCKEILSLGMYIVGIFDTPFKSDIDATLDCVGKVNALFKLANKMQVQSHNGAVVKGIGMAYGKVQLTKCIGGEQTVVCWDGETIETAQSLSKKAIIGNNNVYATNTIYNNLKEDYQKLFSKVNSEDYFESDPINIAMYKWIKANI